MSIEEKHKSATIVNAYTLLSLMDVRAVNDQLMQLERAFIDQNPLLGRVTYRWEIMVGDVFISYITCTLY